MKNELQQNRKGNRIFPIFRRVKASIYREFHEEKELNQPLFYFRYTPLVIYRARTKRFFYLLKLSLFRLFVFFDCRSEGDMILVTIAMLTGP